MRETQCRKTHAEIQFSLVAFKYVFELLLKQNQEKNIAAGHREIQWLYTGSKLSENGKDVPSSLPDWNQGDNLSFTIFFIGFFWFGANILILL